MGPLTVIKASPAGRQSNPTTPAISEMVDWIGSDLVFGPPSQARIITPPRSSTSIAIFTVVSAPLATLRSLALSVVSPEADASTEYVPGGVSGSGILPAHQTESGLSRHWFHGASTARPVSRPCKIRNGSRQAPHFLRSGRGEEDGADNAGSQERHTLREVYRQTPSVGRPRVGHARPLRVTRHRQTRGPLASVRPERGSTAPLPQTQRRFA